MRAPAPIFRVFERLREYSIVAARTPRVGRDWRLRFGGRILRMRETREG